MPENLPRHVRDLVCSHGSAPSLNRTRIAFGLMKQGAVRAGECEKVDGSALSPRSYAAANTAGASLTSVCGSGPDPHPAHFHYYSLKLPRAGLMFPQQLETVVPQAVLAERRARLFGVHRLR